MKKIVLIFKLIEIILEFLYKRIKNRQMYICISTPCYGNVGDHAIELAQQEVLKKCGLKDRYIDISSIEYTYLKRIIKTLIYQNDVIIIDGGGNFGDTWPETMQNINEIVLTYSDNRIFIFPESWYFSNTKEGEKLLKETINIFNSHKNITLYARDSWSYKEMKNHLTNITIRYSFDMVLFKNYVLKKLKPFSKKTIGLSLRDDKECVSGSLTKKLYKDMETLDIKTIIINNDSYNFIDKKNREKVFNRIIKMYEQCDIIITDRFHGFIFSILCQKPCIIFDNLTGKIGHFYNDIKDDISGCVYINSNDYDKKLLIDFINSNEKIFISENFYQNKEKYLNYIQNDLLKWEEK